MLVQPHLPKMENQGPYTPPSPTPAQSLLTHSPLHLLCSTPSGKITPGPFLTFYLSNFFQISQNIDDTVIAVLCMPHGTYQLTTVYSFTSWLLLPGACVANQVSSHSLLSQKASSEGNPQLALTGSSCSAGRESVRCLPAPLS